MQEMTGSGELRLDSEGYLVDPADWDRGIAIELASSENIVLTEDHWRVIEFMRSYFDKNQVAADARFVIRYLADEVGYGKSAKAILYQLFPYGYVKQACKIAGMKRPRAWSTG